jgi:hypothetical protein
MSSSSAPQQHRLNDFWATSSHVLESNPNPTTINSVAADAPVAPVTALNVPEFGARGALYSLTARLAGRLNAANISDKEHEYLLQRRQRLLDKALDGTISRTESLKLEYVRWSLDTIEDAKHGYELDVLEDAVAMYERFASDVVDLKRQLIQRTRRRR